MSATENKFYIQKDFQIFTQVGVILYNCYINIAEYTLYNNYIIIYNVYLCITCL